MYSKGTGVPQDYKEAAKWTLKAAEQGYGPAKNSIGSMDDDSDDFPQNDK